jgi:hypothetical protein
MAAPHGSTHSTARHTRRAATHLWIVLAQHLVSPFASSSLESTRWTPTIWPSLRAHCTTSRAMGGGTAWLYLACARGCQQHLDSFCGPELWPHHGLSRRRASRHRLAFALRAAGPSPPSHTRLLCCGRSKMPKRTRNSDETTTTTKETTISCKVERTRRSSPNPSLTARPLTAPAPRVVACTVYGVGPRKRGRGARLDQRGEPRRKAHTQKFGAQKPSTNPIGP